MIARTLLTLSLVAALAACQTSVEAPVDDTPVRVRAFVERADVTPGKPFILTVEIDRRRDVTFTLPDVGADIEGLIIMNTKSQVPEQVGDRELLRSTYKLKAPRAGTYLIPAVEGPWKTKDNQVGTAGTGAILIEAARRAGEEGAGEQELHDLKPVAAPDPDPRAWIAAGIAATTLAILGFLLWRRRSPGEVLPPPLPADRQALLELAGLAELDLADPANHPTVAYEVSAVLRRYLEARFAFAAAKMTTTEVLRSMPTNLAQQRAVPSAIQEVLEASDRVKFAGESVSTAVIESWISRARKVVEVTALPPETEDAA
jgi:hypothetical protein